MNIIGIYAGHNASACLLRHGKIECAVSEEKFNNIKNWMGMPLSSIEWCAQYAFDHNETIDAIAIAGETPWLPNSNNLNKLPRLKHFLKDRVFSQIRFIWLQNLLSKLHKVSYKLNENSTREKIANMLAKWVEPKNIFYIEHHSCHAASAYHGLVVDPTKKTLIFTLDGYGDFLSATVSIGLAGEIKRISATPMAHSIGSMYGKTTQFLGMRENEHEYKVMGLAPYSKEYYKDLYERVFRGMIYRDPGQLEFKSKIDTQYFKKYLESCAVGERFDNVAAALQACTEDLVADWISTAIQKTGISTICTAGGVFMNVKTNMKIAEMPEVEDVYFMPSCGDETTPIGAAYLLAKRLGEKKVEPFKNIYWGFGYSNEDVRIFLEANSISVKYDYTYVEDIELRTAQLLAENKIVARVNGRCEFGARALGNRSILANPSDMESFYTVNDQIKCRDFWMPFAPSILYEEQNKYVVNKKNIEAPYMILGFNSTDLAQAHLRAAMHQGDKSVRAQLVKQEANPAYYRLITNFRDLTGIGGVMNTSFNIHGYPLVGTLEQAIFTFEHSGLEYLTLENYLLTKR